ncbi:HTH tetR-type domain-containing protein [Novosphingobium lubricantis]|jgi:AcrR family transcriptional regulator
MRVTDRGQSKHVRERPSKNSSLSPDAWTDAALSALAIHGIDGVRVEVLARDIDVTKGSFYWHFKDRDALLVKMLERWRERTTLALMKRLDSASEFPEERLRQLLRLPMQRERSAFAAEVELAIRMWSRKDARALAVLEEVDELRLSYIERLLIGSAVPASVARARAVLAYSYMRVAATLVPPSAEALMGQCEDLIIGK